MNLSIFRAMFIIMMGGLQCILFMMFPIGIFSIYRTVSAAIFALGLSYHCYPYFKKFVSSRRIVPNNKAILITGSASGFGWELAKRLDSEGFHVFASCRSTAGANVQRLRASCSQRLHVLQMDVTEEESVADAYEYVKNNLNDCCLWAVVNNAGVHVGFEITWSSMDSIEKNFDVNTLGLIRVVNTFLPLLKQSQGRVVTVSRIAGRICLLHNSVYTMSKFSSVGFTECLEQELKRTGVKAFSIEPYIFKTRMVDRVMQELEELPFSNHENLSLFGKDYPAQMKDLLTLAVDRSPEDSSAVIEALVDVITLKDPSATYYKIWTSGRLSEVHKMIGILLTCAPSYGLRMWNISMNAMIKVPIFRKFIVITTRILFNK